jgi:Na+/melibiose symporter-like transporter
MSSDPQERTELMAWKHGLTGLGVLLSSAVAPALVGHMGGGRPAYLTTATLVGVLCLICLVTAWKFAGRIPDGGNRGKPLSLRDLPNAFRDRDFAVLCLSAVIMTVASGISYASFAFFVKFAMHRADAFAQIGVMSAIMAVAVMAGSPIWVGVAARIGKKATYVVGACGHGLVTIAWGWMADGPIVVAYVLAGLMAMFNAGWGLIVLSLLSDTIADARERWGENRAGVYSAIWSIIEKAGIALGGTLIVGALLSASGFDAVAAQKGAEQSAEAISGIVMSYAIVPGVAKLIAAAIIWRFVGTGKGRADVA